MQVSAGLFTPELPACRLRRIGAHTGCRQPPTFSFGAAFLMSLAIVLAGFVGELVLSAVKRSLGAKDWGAMIAGHGGALDRVDSICLPRRCFSTSCVICTCRNRKPFWTFTRFVLAAARGRNARQRQASMPLLIACAIRAMVAGLRSRVSSSGFAITPASTSTAGIGAVFSTIRSSKR